MIAKLAFATYWDLLREIIGEAGDHPEGWSPELVGAARTALVRYSDETWREAE